MPNSQTQRKGLPPSGADARLLTALKERSQEGGGALRLVKSDAAVLTGLPVDQADEALRAVARDYRSHLMVTEQGELVYEFAPGLVRRDAEALSQRLYAWARPLLQLLWRGFTVGFKIWIAATLVVYTVLFAALGIALMLAGEGDNDGPGYLLWWLLPDFGPRRDEDAWSRRRRLAGPERPRKRFYRSVFDFVFGPPESASAQGRPQPDDRLLLGYIRDQKGRISASDLVMLTGWDYRRAEEEATRLLTQYDGEPEVAEDGTLIYSFRDLRRTASALPQLPPPVAPPPPMLAPPPWTILTTAGPVSLVPQVEQATVPGVWDQHEVTPSLTGNTTGSNVLVSALNGFNLLASTSIGPWVVLWLGLGAVPALLLTLVPLTFSLTFFGVPTGRYLAERFRRPRRLRRNLRRALLRAIRARSGEPMTLDEIAREAVRHVLSLSRRHDEPARVYSHAREQQAAALLPLAHEELLRLLPELEGDVALPGPDEQDDPPGLRYQFPRLREELGAVTRARQQAEDAERQVGEVIFSSASEGAGV